MKTYNDKYYIIKRGINGKLLDVWGVNRKTDLYEGARESIDDGYQITVVSRGVLMTADNLGEARAKLGLPQYL